GIALRKIMLLRLSADYLSDYSETLAGSEQVPKTIQQSNRMLPESVSTRLWGTTHSVCTGMVSLTEDIRAFVFSVPLCSAVSIANTDLGCDSERNGHTLVVALIGEWGPLGDCRISGCRETEPGSRAMPADPSGCHSPVRAASSLLSNITRNRLNRTGPGNWIFVDMVVEGLRESYELDAASDKQPDSVNEERGILPEHDEAADTNAGSSGSPVPDGGTQAWLQVLGSWMLFFNTWGILNTFGVFQTYYESGVIFEASSSDISWIGSVQALLLLTVGAFSGPIYDRGGFRWLLVVGSFAVVFGHMMLSFCKRYWEVLLAQGVMIGIGGGCLYVPAVAIMPTYFTSRLGLALGLAASGSSTGGIIYPIMFSKLIDQVGFGWSVRILGFTALATLIVPLVVMKTRVTPGKVRSIIDWTAFIDWPYMTFVVGCLIGFMGLYTTFFYISYFGQASGITDASLSFYLIPILNAGSVFGRTVPNWLSDQIGPLNVIAPSALLFGVVILCNLAVHNVGGIILTTLFLGFFSGVFVALPPALLVALTKDKSKIGSRIGMGLALAGLGVLVGGPGSGRILGDDDSDLNWTGVWVFAGVVALSGGVIFAMLRLWRGGFKLMVKV
ncbi:MAG: hypothetical protein Q9181_005662, partial [Wetmoreana brouardii]